MDPDPPSRSCRRSSRLALPAGCRRHVRCRSPGPGDRRQPARERHPGLCRRGGAGPAVPGFRGSRGPADEPLRIADLRAGKSVVAELRLRCKDGRLLPVELTTRMLPERPSAGRRAGHHRAQAGGGGRCGRARAGIARCSRGRATPSSSWRTRASWTATRARWRSSAAPADEILGHHLRILSVRCSGTDPRPSARPRPGCARRWRASRSRSSGSTAARTARPSMPRSRWPGWSRQGRVYLQAIVRDVTERRRPRRERLEMERRLLHAQKLESLGVLAGGIAHDFNNLLMAILGNLELALRDLSPVSPVRSRLEAVGHAARRAADLTRQMLAYSGRGRFMVGRLDLNELVEENVHLLRTSIPRTVTLNLHLDRALPAVEADAGQIQQVIMNLITNASEAIGGEPGVITLSTGVAGLRRLLPGPEPSRRDAACRALRLPRGGGHRLRDGRADAEADVRSVLHHEVHRPRARHGGGARDRAGPPRRDPARQRPGEGGHDPGAVPRGRGGAGSRRPRRRVRPPAGIEAAPPGTGRGTILDRGRRGDGPASPVRPWWSPWVSRC